MNLILSVSKKYLLHLMIFSVKIFFLKEYFFVSYLKGKKNKRDISELLKKFF
jgi:hypothetical protein